MLEIRGLHVQYGPIRAVQGIDINVAKGQCVSLLGPNGAGKTSTLAALTGVVRASGQMRLDNQDLSPLSVEERVRSGIALSPEGRRVFANLTVRENLLLGGAVRQDKSGLESEIDRWLKHFPILGERQSQPAGTLSGGEQQMLAITRALLSKPRILLLDEPSLGLAPQIVTRIFSIIRDLKQEGMTLLLVEQNVSAAMTVSDYVYVLNNGRISRHGPTDQFGDGTNLMDELTGVHE